MSAVNGFMMYSLAPASSACDTWCISELVVTIISAQGAALGTYIARNTRDKTFAVHSPVGPDSVKLRVNAPRVFKALQKLPNLI